MANPKLADLPLGIYLTSTGELLSVGPIASVITPLTPENMLYLSKILKRGAKELKAGRRLTGAIDMPSEFTILDAIGETQH